ncbi:MAG TPA: hypothetical protein VFN77_04770 [Acetobacteraceae bacterium]|nr:hypothetical protein [Acetobacteraceae bacterium]
MSETITPSESPKPDHVILSENPPAEPVASEPVRRGWPASSVLLGLILLILLLGIGGGVYIARQRAAMSSEIAALKARIGAMDGQIGALKAQTARIAAKQAVPTPPVQAKLSASAAAEINGLQQNVTSLAATVAVDHTALAGVQSSLKDMQSGLGDVPRLAARAQRMDRIAAAILALQTGQPLGAIPDAPPALARFASAKPPTESGLRLAFPADARKAELAGGDVPASGGFWQRVRMRAASLVTIRRGDKVLVGSRAEADLAAARQALDAGDLQGAVAALDGLPPPAKAAMQGWIGQAKALLAARKVLISMAEPR